MAVVRHLGWWDWMVICTDCQWMAAGTVWGLDTYLAWAWQHNRNHHD